jgi:hypothetical protein
VTVIGGTKQPDFVIVEIDLYDHVLDGRHAKNPYDRKMLAGTELRQIRTDDRAGVAQCRSIKIG